MDGLSHSDLCTCLHASDLRCSCLVCGGLCGDLSLTCEGSEISLVIIIVSSERDRGQSEIFRLCLGALIEIVIVEGASEIAEMDADLMGATGDDFCQRAELFRRFIPVDISDPGDCTLSAAVWCVGLDGAVDDEWE